MKKIAILINTYTEFDFLVSPLIKLIGKFWENHPPVFVIGTNRLFPNSNSISTEGKSLKNWVSNYHEGLKQLKQNGFDGFYLILDDLHPIGTCNSEYLNYELPQKAEEFNAGYVYLMGHFNLLKATECSHPDWLQLTPNHPYYLSVQIGYWNTDYAMKITQRILDAGIQSIWKYEITGSTLDFEDSRPNFIIKQRTKCLLSPLLIEELPQKVRWHISQTPYPYVKGGYLYQGRSTPITRLIYHKFLGEDPEIQQMIKFTLSPHYKAKYLTKRVKHKIKSLIL